MADTLYSLVPHHIFLICMTCGASYYSQNEEASIGWSQWYCSCCDESSPSHHQMLLLFQVTTVDGIGKVFLTDPLQGSFAFYWYLEPHTVEMLQILAQEIHSKLQYHACWCCHFFFPSPHDPTWKLTCSVNYYLQHVNGAVFQCGFHLLMQRGWKVQKNVHVTHPDSQRSMQADLQQTFLLGVHLSQDKFAVVFNCGFAQVKSLADYNSRYYTFIPYAVDTFHTQIWACCGFLNPQHAHSLADFLQGFHNFMALFTQWNGNVIHVYSIL